MDPQSPNVISREAHGGLVKLSGEEVINRTFTNTKLIEFVETIKNSPKLKRNEIYNGFIQMNHTKHGRK